MSRSLGQKATLQTVADTAKLSTTYSQTNGGSPTNLRALSLDTPTFDGSFTFSKISSNQDGLFAVKNLTVTGGFGGQVGQGGVISYFKAVGIAAHHSGIGNYDHFWGSLYHDGTREAGMFIADITSRRGGNAYGGHFRVTSQTTAPAYHVGLAIENIPTVAKSTQTTLVLSTTVPAATPTTSIVLTTAVQLTDGTNLSFTADDATTVVAYVNGSMGASSTTVPVTSFTTSSQISSGSNVKVAVASTYLGLDMQNNGSQSLSAAVSVSAPLYSGNPATTPPFVFGINFDISAANPNGTAINIGGVWGNALNCNGANINNIGSMVGVGSSPNRDVRLVDNMLLDNARYIKFKDSGGTAQKAISATSSNNMRFKLIAASTQFEFYDNVETTLLARVTSSGRADFSLAGVTTKYTSGASQPSYLTNGQVEVWHDTGSGNDYLVVNVNGVSKKVVLA